MSLSYEAQIYNALVELNVETGLAAPAATLIAPSLYEAEESHAYFFQDFDVNPALSELLEAFAQSYHDLGADYALDELRIVLI